MKKLFFILLVFPFIVQTVGAVVDPLAGTKNEGLLNAPMAVRPAGMGNAYIAAANDIHSIYTNPAGLGYLRHVEINLGRTQGFEGISISHVAMSFPSGLLSAGNSDNLGTLAVGVGYMDYGQIDARDRNGNPAALDLGTREILADVSYGKTFYDHLALGVNAKYYYQQYSEAFNKNINYDLGVQYKVNLNPNLWSVGLAVKNMGGGIRLIQTDEAIPQTVTAGVAFTPWGDRLTLAFDIEDPGDNGLGYKAGVEYWATKMFAFRTGYDSTNQLGLGLTAGFSIRLIEVELAFFPIRHLTLDYAYVPSTNLGDVHQFALTARFGDQ